MKVLRNEKGNMTLLLLGSISIFTLMLGAVLSFSNVFIKKEQASDNAEQASLVASSIVLERLEEAIYDYDDSIRGEVEDFLGKSLEKKVEKKQEQLKNQDPELSNSEAKHQAINAVLKTELQKGNQDLQQEVAQQLRYAESEIISAVRRNISENNGEISGTEISLFNNQNRIEISTATRYKAVQFDAYYPDNKRNIEQIGQGPTFDFIEGMSNWSWRYVY